MAVLPILTAPHPVLAAAAREVREDELGDALVTLLSDMAETMYAAPGVGLAAPQVGDGRRIVVIDSGVDSGVEGGSGLLKLVNPKIVEHSEETIPWTETCLSVPELEVKMDRWRRVRMTWLTAQGEPKDQWFEDFEAVIVQHELDHLEGDTLLDRVSAFRRSRYMRKLKKAGLR